MGSNPTPAAQPGLPARANPFAFLDAATFEEEQRVTLELTRPRLLDHLAATVGLFRHFRKLRDR